MPRKRTSKSFPGYYSTARTMELLKVSKEGLYTYVRNGKLKQRIPPGRKQAVYSIEMVDKLVREQHEFEIQASLAMDAYTPTFFVRAQPGDMDETAKLINALFDHWPNVERWKEYLRRCPDGGYLLRTQDQIVGCAFVFPLNPEKIDEIFTYEETNAPSILPEDVHPYEPGRPLHLYVRAVGVLPGIPKIDKRVWGSRLLSRLVDTFIDFGARGIEIKTIQSRSRTPDGIKILRHIGFTEVPSKTTSHTFLIDVESSGLPAIQKYKNALEKWKKEHPSN